jgi:hypothetical protein
MSELLKKYLERRYIDRNDKAVSGLFPTLGAYLRSRKVWKRLQHKGHHHRHEGDSTTLQISGYDGKNKTVQAIQQYLQLHKHPAIKAAFVQGSIADSEETSFSDFDGIILIDPVEIYSTSQLRALHKIVHKTAHLMKKMDPLQHHGWSVLLSNELNRYPDAQLPSILLEKSKSIYPSTGYSVTVKIDPAHQDYSILYEDLCQGIYKRSAQKSTLEQFYYSKLFISECLLLPAAFLQALNKKPIWKKESFEVIQQHLPATHLETIATIEKIRADWSMFYKGESARKQPDAKLSEQLRSLFPKMKALIDEMDRILKAHQAIRV